MIIYFIKKIQAFVFRKTNLEDKIKKNFGFVKTN